MDETILSLNVLFLEKDLYTFPDEFQSFFHYFKEIKVLPSYLPT